MTLRLAAAFALVMGAATLLAYCDVMGHGPLADRAARHLRAMKDRRASPASAEAVGLAEFRALPHHVAVAEYARIEARGVVMEGYVQRLLRASDDDYHMEVTPTPRAPGGPDTMYVTAEITPGVRRSSADWSYAHLARSLRPNHGGETEWDEGPRRVRVTGWLLYDYQYDETPSVWEQRLAAPRISGWEIHPVTRIEVWDDSLRRYRDVAR